MFKKLFILFVLFCTSITCVQATEEDKILGVIAVLTNTGLYNAPKWADTFKYKNNIAIRQMTLKNKETAGIVLHHTYGVTKWDVTGSYEFWTMYYGYDSYVYEYQPEIPDAIYRYKLEGNKIYKYDRPETGWEWTIFDFFKFEAEGNLVATYEITDDGTVTKYNLNGEKVSGFRIIDKNNICEYDAEGNIIDYYNMFTLNEYYSKKKSNAVQNTTSTNVNSSAIIPILAAVAKSSDKYDWTKEFNDTSSVTQYNAKGSRVATFNIFGSDITQYNAKGNRSGSFYISGDHITQALFISQATILHNIMPTVKKSPLLIYSAVILRNTMPKATELPLLVCSKHIHRR